MHELAGRQFDPEKRARRDAAVVEHYLAHKSFYKAGQEFKLNRVKIGEILRRAGALDAQPEQS